MALATGGDLCLPKNAATLSITTLSIITLGIMVQHINIKMRYSGIRIKELDILMLGIVMLTVIHAECRNGTAHFKKFKQLFEYKHLLLLRDIWWSKF
jgi:hypothetical protein